MSEGESHERKTWWLSVGMVACLGVFIVGLDLNGYRTLTKHEGFVAVVSREMLQSGDWVVPQFGGLPRLKKPPLGYWSAALVSSILGEHAPWTARLPFAISGLALAGLVGVWAGRWHGRWCGLSAAIVQMTSVYFISFSRKAEVDMLLCLLTTLALFLVANGSRDESRLPKSFRWIAIYGLIGLAWLAKFHYGPAMVLGVIAAWHIVDQRRPGIWDALNPLGLCILAAAVVIWPWLLLQRVPEAWDIWQTETIGRALGELGREPVWFYVPQVFLQALPWSVLLWRAGKDSYLRAWKEGDRRERFLWVWFVTQFVILSASAFKHHHYLMAAMPALSLILGRTLHAVCSELREGTIQLTRKHILWLTGIAGTVGAGIAVAISLHWPHLTEPAIGLGVAVIGTGFALGYFIAKQNWTLALFSLSLGFVIAYAITTAVIFPNRDRRLHHVEFAQDVRQTVSAQEPICLYGLKEDPLVYYLAGPVVRVESAADLHRELIHHQGLVIISDSARISQWDCPGYTLQTVSMPEQIRAEQPALVLARILPDASARARSIE